VKNARTTRTALGVPCATMPCLAWVSRKRTDCSDFLKTFWAASRLGISLSPLSCEKVFENLPCVRAFSRIVMPSIDLWRTEGSASSCTAVRLPKFAKNGLLGNFGVSAIQPPWCPLQRVRGAHSGAHSGTFSPKCTGQSNETIYIPLLLYYNYIYK